jgi:hypothetical protein
VTLADRSIMLGKKVIVATGGMYLDDALSGNLLNINFSFNY